MELAVSLEAMREDSKGGMILHFQSRPNSERRAYATFVTSIQYSYKCIGANDRIFDHFIFLNSTPTTPSASSVEVQQKLAS